MLRYNGFSVSRSRMPAGRIAVDVTIEQTINKHARRKGGIAEFSRSLLSYYRCSVTKHNRAEFTVACQNYKDGTKDNFPVRYYLYQIEMVTGQRYRFVNLIAYGASDEMKNITLSASKATKVNLIVKVINTKGSSADVLLSVQVRNQLLKTISLFGGLTAEWVEVAALALEKCTSREDEIEPYGAVSHLFLHED
ncbi:hypothetical protein PoB_003105500 [Plakobranchus ocellatus]|uniref:Uncharacterized protein n=1 Tax=Plakobranchus ocellatus TaxID=259542 RepID=A0AAV4AAY4_9GAST|nr:hypothetical protein PoB_003105500 [Plakobranchus ocellatus]